jgi:CBS domain-containing protein
MTTAREIMTERPRFITGERTIAEASEMMAADGIGAVPVCDGDGHLTGMLTDRDIVVDVVAAHRDPQECRVDQVVERTEVVTIGADDPVEEAVRTMRDHGVLRLPVIDGTDLVGMVSQADLARAVPDARLGDLVGDVKSQPAQN